MKIKTFLNSIIVYLNQLKAKIHLFHLNLLQVNVNEITEPKNKNPYQALIEWCLDVLQYGFILGTIYFSFTLNISSLLLKMVCITLSLGMLRWLVLDTLKNIKEMLR